MRPTYDKIRKKIIVYRCFSRSTDFLGHFKHKKYVFGLTYEYISISTLKNNNFHNFLHAYTTNASFTKFEEKKRIIRFLVTFWAF